MRRASSTNPFRNPTVCLLLLLLSLLLPERAPAWGYLGHRIVCDIAYRTLGESTRARLDGLVESYRKPNGKAFKSYLDSCVLADIARHNARDGVRRWRRFARFERWHFMNLPRGAQSVEAAHCADDCVLFAIEHHAAQLRDHDLSIEQRAEALILLSHWVADIHQPLHVAFADDRGGSTISVSGPYYAVEHFHAVWDTGIMKRARGGRSSRRYVSDLVKRLTPEIKTAWATLAESRRWAEESFELTISPALGYCRRDPSGCNALDSARRLDADYQREFQPVVERRLLQAGVRLAALIERQLALADSSQ